MPPEGGDLIFDRLLHEYCATSTWRVPQNQREFLARMDPTGIRVPSRQRVVIRRDLIERERRRSPSVRPVRSRDPLSDEGGGGGLAKSDVGVAGNWWPGGVGRAGNTGGTCWGGLTGRDR
jgi:hypothetical protein